MQNQIWSQLQEVASMVGYDTKFVIEQANILLGGLGKRKIPLTTEEIELVTELFTNIK